MNRRAIFSVLMSTCFITGILVGGCTKDSSNPPVHVLVLGNSITYHPITSYWWGEWGMAASKMDQDFVHQLEKKLQRANGSSTVKGYQIWDWERNHTVYDKSNFDTFFFMKPNVVIIRLGENVTDLTNFDVSLQGLIDYVKKKAPDARIIVTGVFWTSEAKDAILSSVAKANGLSYIDLSEFNIAENRSFVGATVYDASGNPHLIDNSTVAYHPNDLGMTAIANALYEAIREKIKMPRD
jgi:hypothetical protein